MLVSLQAGPCLLLTGKCTFLTQENTSFVFTPPCIRELPPTLMRRHPSLLPRRPALRCADGRVDCGRDHTPPSAMALQRTAPRTGLPWFSWRACGSGCERWAPQMGPHGCKTLLDFASPPALAGVRVISTSNVFPLSTPLQRRNRGSRGAWVPTPSPALHPTRD